MSNESPARDYAYLDAWEDFTEKAITLVAHYEGQSDRAVALLAAAWLEYTLGEKIREGLPNEKAANDVLKRSLGSFANRVRYLRTEGVIPDGAASGFDAVRRIRNKFAHGLFEARGFGEPGIQELVSKLKLRGQMPHAPARSIFVWTAHTPASASPF